MAAEPLVFDSRTPGFSQPRPCVDFEALYREHFDRLRRFLLGVTGQEELASDLAQEALARAYARLGEVDLARPLWPWLKCVARRLVVDHRRTAGRELPADGPLVDAPPARLDDIDAVAGRQLLAQTLRDLPARQRAALTLRYLDDWTAAEVASALGLSRMAVEQLLLRARRSFAKQYLELGGEASAQLRVALWPLLALLTRWRERVLRLRRLADSGGAPLTLAADGLTNVVVAVTVSGALLGGGVAMAATPGMPAAVPGVSASDVADTREATRALPGKEHLARSAVRVQHPRTAAGARTDEPASRAVPAARAVGVVAAPPVEHTPATTAAEASRERERGRLRVKGEARSRIAEVMPASDADAGSNCDASMAGALSCAAADALEEAVR